MDAITGVHRLLNVKTGASLRSGDIISARVDSILSGNRVVLSFGGRTLVARTSLSLQPGQDIRALVSSVPGGWRLRLLSAVDAPGSDVADPRMSSRQIITAALLRAGLPVPDSAELDRQAALLSRSRGERTRLARLYAELRSKGADPSADFLETMDGLLSPHGRHDSEHSDGRPPRKHWQKPPDADELFNELNDEVESEGENEGDSLLRLFSSVKGRNGDWVATRFERDLENRHLSVLFKFRKGLEPAMSLSVQDGNRSFEFLIEGLGPPKLTVYSDGELEVDAAVWEEFHNKLALMNISLSDTILSIKESDGFSRASDEADYVLEAMD